MARLSPMLSFALCASAAAQGVVVQAVTPTGLTVMAGTARQSVPPNTVVTGGASLAVMSPTHPLASATASFTLSSGDDVRFSMRSAAAGAVSPVGAERGLAGRHSVAVTVRSPVTVRAVLTARFCGTPGSLGGASTVLTAGSLPPYLNSPVLGQCSSVPPVVQTFPLVVGPGGVTIVIDQVANGASGFRPDSSSTSVDCTLAADPTDPCTVTPYGNGCGVDLNAGTDLRFPGTTALRIGDPRRPAFAWFLVGGQRAQAPISPVCTIHNDLQILLPVPIDAFGTAGTRVVPPPIPGLVFFVQGATFDGVTLLLSQGLDCRRS